jgi:murein DD-endopeptidase MepM/ murein hydrolase activator NlpD
VDKHIQLVQYIRQNPEATGKVVDYDPVTDRLYQFDFTVANAELSSDEVSDTERFSAWVNSKLTDANYTYGIGGYMEHRTLYARSPLFDTVEEPRRLHLGVDIWAKAGTPVYAPFDAVVHSFNDNDRFGDYGPTIILQHDLDGMILYSLYGHLNRQCLERLYEGKPIAQNQQIGLFGQPNENGNWPPHLHFQLMFDIGICKGDYPGVGRFSQKKQLMVNIPDPQLVLRFRY